MTNFLKIRPIIYTTLITLFLCSFMFSYAVNAICIGLFVVFFLIDSKQNLKNKLSYIKKTPVLLFYLLFFICNLIGLSYTSNLEIGYQKIIQLLPAALLPFVALTEKNDNKYSFIAIEFLKFFTVLIFINYLMIHLFAENRPLNNFVQFVVNEKLGMSQFYLAVIVLIPLLHSLNAIEKKQQIVYNSFFVVFFFFSLLILQNKTTILILGLILFIKLFIFLKKRLSIVKSFGITFFVLIFLSIVTFSVPQVKNKFEIITKSTDFNLETIITKNKVTHTKNTIEHRFLINYLAIKEIKESFPFGVGTGDYLDILYKNYNAIKFKTAISEKLNNHNQYLSEFLKTGILSGSCFIIIILLLLKSASFKDEFFLYLILFFSLACFLESYLDRHYGVMIFSFVLPFFLNFEKTKNRTH